MRVIRSLLHPRDLGQLVRQEYELDGPTDVQLLRRGFNDTYLVTEPSGNRFVLRVYAREKYWIRSGSDLLFELELLEHLESSGRAVAGPYRRTVGNLIGQVDAPEGTRCFALFTYGDGVPSGETDHDSGRMRALGTEIARMHQAMDGFESDHDRYHLDLDLLINMPLEAIETLIGPEQATEYARLRSVGQRLRDHIAGLSLPAAAYGPIHADLPGNINVEENGAFTLFDFDHCGNGWRAYDLAAFHPDSDAPAHEHAGWSALLAGYESVRPLSAPERDALPTFAACRALWNVGDWLRAASWAGQHWSPETLCTQTLDRIRSTGSFEHRVNLDLS